MATGTTSMEDLINMLDVSNNILLYNSEIEDTIRTHGGTVAYSYNNVIMASEISETLYNELKKSPYIDYMESLPLKKFGDIDYNLIDQIDIANFIGLTLTGSTNISGNAKDRTNDNLPPSITNNNYILSGITNQKFEYLITATGTTPITLDFVKPQNYIGDLSVYNANILTGNSYQSGIYDIILTAKNQYGYDSKTLSLSIIEFIKILNTNLSVYSKVGSQFSYTIESSGSLPKIYTTTTLPSGLILINNIISGTTATEGSYSVTITVSGNTSSDSKTLSITIGNAPIITSAGEISSEQYSNFSYNITSISIASYKIIGSLPSGLILKVDNIYGVPTISGEYNLKIQASNAFGSSTKNLKIIIYSMGT